MNSPISSTWHHIPFEKIKLGSDTTQNSGHILSTKFFNTLSCQFFKKVWSKEKDNRRHKKIKYTPDSNN